MTIPDLPEPPDLPKDLMTDLLLVIVVMLAIGVLGAAATLETQPDTQHVTVETKTQDTQQ